MALPISSYYLLYSNIGEHLDMDINVPDLLLIFVTTGTLGSAGGSSTAIRTSDS